eukprot:103583_1
MEEEKKHESKDRISEIKTFCQLRKLLNEQQIETFCQLFDQRIRNLRYGTSNYNVDTLRDELCQGENDAYEDYDDYDDYNFGQKNLTIYEMLTDELCLLETER